MSILGSWVVLSFHIVSAPQIYWDFVGIDVFNPQEKHKNTILFLC